jgi:hypothetical protein
MRKIIKKAAILVIFLGMTACSVYHQDSTNVSSAIDSQNRIKIETTDNLVFELKELRRENGHLIGITRKNSETAKLLVDRNIVTMGNFVKIPLEDEEIRAIYLRSKKMSGLVNIGVPLVGVAGLIGLTNPDFRPNMGY